MKRITYNNEDSIINKSDDDNVISPCAQALKDSAANPLAAERESLKKKEKPLEVFNNDMIDVKVKKTKNAANISSKEITKESSKDLNDLEIAQILTSLGRANHLPISSSNTATTEILSINSAQEVEITSIQQNKPSSSSLKISISDNDDLIETSDNQKTTSSTLNKRKREQEDDQEKNQSNIISEGKINELLELDYLTSDVPPYLENKKNKDSISSENELNKINNDELNFRDVLSHIANSNLQAFVRKLSKVINKSDVTKEKDTLYNIFIKHKESAFNTYVAQPDLRNAIENKFRDDTKRTYAQTLKDIGYQFKNYSLDHELQKLLNKGEQPLESYNNNKLNKRKRTNKNKHEHEYTRASGVNLETKDNEEKDDEDSIVSISDNDDLIETSDNQKTTSSTLNKRKREQEDGQQKNQSNIISEGKINELLELDYLTSDVPPYLENKKNKDSISSANESNKINNDELNFRGVLSKIANNSFDTFVSKLIKVVNKTGVEKDTLYEIFIKLKDSAFNSYLTQPDLRKAIENKFRDDIKRTYAQTLKDIGYQFKNYSLDHELQKLLNKGEQPLESYNNDKSNKRERTNINKLEYEYARASGVNLETKDNISSESKPNNKVIFRHSISKIIYQILRTFISKLTQTIESEEEREKIKTEVFDSCSKLKKEAWDVYDSNPHLSNAIENKFRDDIKRTYAQTLKDIGYKLDRMHKLDLELQELLNKGEQPLESYKNDIANKRKSPNKKKLEHEDKSKQKEIVSHSTSSSSSMLKKRIFKHKGKEIYAEAVDPAHQDLFEIVEINYEEYQYFISIPGMFLTNTRYARASGVNLETKDSEEKDDEASIISISDNDDLIETSDNQKTTSSTLNKRKREQEDDEPNSIKFSKHDDDESDNDGSLGSSSNTLYSNVSLRGSLVSTSQNSNQQQSSNNANNVQKDTYATGFDLVLKPETLMILGVSLVTLDFVSSSSSFALSTFGEGSIANEVFSLATSTF
jgi:hypothetical protein